MAVKSVPTEGWTRGTVAATIRFVTQQQRDALAERVRAEMERRGWNNPKLAREAELSEKTISRVINARKDPRLDTIERIARAFKMDERDLRPPPPAPLGLGADKKPTQLDRIELRLGEIYKLLSEEAAGTVSSDDAARAVAESGADIEAATEPPPDPTPARPAKSRAGARRTRA